VGRDALHSEKLVYVGVANRKVKYPRGRSAIVYIGTTKRGVGRIAGSAASKARQMLRRPGLKELRFVVVTCTARPGTPAWKRLERALLLTFKFKHETVPVGNHVGKNFEPRDEGKYFQWKRLRSVIQEVEQKGS
jgi:hypothetical protein